MENRLYEVEIFTDEDGITKVHIAADGASGCSYKVENEGQIGKYVADYVRFLKKTRQKSQ